MHPVDPNGDGEEEDDDGVLKKKNSRILINKAEIVELEIWSASNLTGNIGKWRQWFGHQMWTNPIKHATFTSLNLKLFYFQRRGGNKVIKHSFRMVGKVKKP